jgi:hypothetical protein
MEGVSEGQQSQGGQSGGGGGGSPEAIKKSCEYVLEKASRVRIDSEALERLSSALVTGVSEEGIPGGDDLSNKLSPALVLPLNFSDIEAHINFLTFVHLHNLNSLDPQVHKHIVTARDRDLQETVLHGALSLHLSGHALTARFLADLTLDDIRTHFDIPFLREREIQPAIYAVEKNELYPLAQLLLEVSQAAGKKLQTLGKRDFGDLILSHLRSSTPPSAVALSRFLTETLPSLEDKTAFQGREVVFGRTQLLVGELFCLFRDKNPLFAFSDIESLTVYPDRHLFDPLLRAGVLKVQTEGEEAAAVEPGSELETELRAATVIASETLVARSKATSKPYTALAFDRALRSARSR